MSSDEQPRVAPVSGPDAAPAPEPIPAAINGPEPKRRWSTVDLWMLGIFSALGLVGFIATFVLVVMRSPGSPAPRALPAVETQRVERVVGPPGERGLAGPAGPRGPAGESGIRILRNECSTGTCTTECADDEVLLNAYCNPNRAPAVYPTESSALCRATGRRIEVVAACVKSSRR
jgi:hypothetical protein